MSRAIEEILHFPTTEVENTSLKSVWLIRIRPVLLEVPVYGQLVSSNIAL